MSQKVRRSCWQEVTHALPRSPSLSLSPSAAHSRLQLEATSWSVFDQREFTCVYICFNYASAVGFRSKIIQQRAIIASIKEEKKKNQVVKPWSSAAEHVRQKRKLHSYVVSPAQLASLD